MNDLVVKIDECIQRKNGNKEFALFYLDNGWRAEIGNPVDCVGLGESCGEFVSDVCSTAIEAVMNLAERIPTK